MKLVTYAIFLILFAAMANAADYEAQRAALIWELRQYAEILHAEEMNLSDPVLATLDKVERHRLVPEAQRRYSYENRPLPIGYGQTISQPYIVALMTQLVDPDPDDIVLEVGTGSGYQAAVLAEMVGQVFSIEIIEQLAVRARRDLDTLGYENITTKLGDGYYGWEEHGPFDAIVVTAAASHVPPPLIEQLKPGGRMVIPVGGRFTTQTLLLLEKTNSGEVITRQYGAVRFVPLTGKH